MCLYSCLPLKYLQSRRRSYNCQFLEILLGVCSLLLDYIWHWIYQTDETCCDPRNIKLLYGYKLGLESFEYRSIQALRPFPYKRVTAWTSSISTLRSYASSCISSKTAFSVMGRPSLRATTWPGWARSVRLMNRNRCFWFMQDAAWMCVSTFLKVLYAFT